MKKSVILFILLCGVIAGAIVYLNQSKSPPRAPAAESAVNQHAPGKNVEPGLEPLQPMAANANEPAKAPVATPVISEAKPDDSSSPIHKAVEALLAAKTGTEKNELFQQLVKSGQIDQAIAELRQRAADDPSNPKLPTTIGEALLNKVRALHDAGGADVNEMGILAMQADQSFNAALKIDPQNWEANFVKAASMYYWPADAARDADVVQRLSGLIDQQETMPPNPAFVQTYVVLGSQYDKMGQHDQAVATWQLGLQKFPNDPTLLKKINGQ